MIPEVANHLINSGGKRLRPILTLALARLTGYAGDGHIKLAAAVEFMHTATLLHDDVVDESELRRGRLAARMLWGNEASVLVGDFLLGQAFKMMVEVGSLKALEILSSAAAVIAEGEVMQLAAAKNTATTEDEYIAVIRAKTAELFAAACEVGPVLSGAAEGRAGRLPLVRHESRHHLPARRRRARLRRRRAQSSARTSATISARARSRCRSCWRSAAARDAEREFWRRTLERGEANDADLEHAIGLMAKHRALEDTIGRAHHYGAIARDALALFPDFADEIGARRDGRFLHRAHALKRLSCGKRINAGAPQRGRARAHPPLRVLVAQASPRRPTAAAAEANSAKQVAPEPDMRASRQSGQRAQRREHLGDRRRERDRGSFEIVATAATRNCNSSLAARHLARSPHSRARLGGAAAGVQRANTSLVASATPGLTSTAGSGGSASGAESMSPMPLIRRGARIEADRHVGAGRAGRLVKPRIVAAKTVGAREKPQRRGRIGRAAAESGRDRQQLFEVKGAETERRECARRAHARP